MRTLSDNTIDILIKLLVIAIIASALYLIGDFAYNRYWPKETEQTRSLIQKYEKELKNDPGSIALRTQLAQIYLSVGRYEQAAEHFKQVLKLNKEFGPARVGLGLAYMKNGEDSKALNEFSKEMAIASKGSRAKIDRFLEQSYYFSGMIYLKQESYKQAISNFKKALSISPAASDTYFHLGEAHEAINQIKEARQSYKKALELEPDYEEAKEALNNIDG